MADRVLGPEELSQILNIKRGTLYSHLSRGTPLPPSFRIGSQTRWRESVVWSWIERREKEQRKRSFED
jgi:predicted DNA-binding transcriptional regulator AlpA